jgi:hypothetical protein
MNDGTSWWYFTTQASATQAAAEITALCGCLCQAGHVEDDTIAAPAIGQLDDPERRWVLVVPDHHVEDEHPDADPPATSSCWQIAETHGGVFDTHESGWMPIPDELRPHLPWPN